MVERVCPSRVLHKEALKFETQDSVEDWWEGIFETRQDDPPAEAKSSQNGKVEKKGIE